MVISYIDDYSDGGVTTNNLAIYFEYFDADGNSVVS